jgi:ribosomal protein L10
MEKRKIKSFKVEKVNELTGYLNDNKGIAMFLNNGITANEINDIRKKVRLSGIKTLVAKNSLWKIALNNKVSSSDSSLSIKGKTITFIAQNAIDAVGAHELLTPKEKKLITPVLIADKNGIINDKQKVSQIAKMKNIEGMAVNLVMTIKMPTIKLVKILDIIQQQK